MTNPEQTLLLNKIFQTPSNEIIADRFSPERQKEAGTCTGKCVSGKCKGVAQG